MSIIQVQVQVHRQYGRANGRIYAVNAGGHIVELADDFDYLAMPPGFRLATVTDLRQAIAAAHHQHVHDPAMSGAVRAAGAVLEVAQVVDVEIGAVATDNAHTAHTAHAAHALDDRAVLLERAGHADERAGDPTRALEVASSALALAMQPSPPPSPPPPPPPPAGVRVLTGPSVGEVASATFRTPGERPPGER